MIVFALHTSGANMHTSRLGLLRSIDRLAHPVPKCSEKWMLGMSIYHAMHFLLCVKSSHFPLSGTSQKAKTVLTFRDNRSCACCRIHFSKQSLSIQDIYMEFNALQDYVNVCLQDVECLKICPSSHHLKPCRVCLDNVAFQLRLQGDTAQNVPLSDIIGVRQGWKTDAFSKAIRSHHFRNQLEEDCCFSIVYGPNRQSVDLQAKSSFVALALTTLLTSAVGRHRTNTSRDKRDWLKRQFQQADVDHSGYLNLAECCLLLSQLNASLGADKIAQFFAEANFKPQPYQTEEVLDEEEFVCFYHLVNKRPDLNRLFQEYADVGLVGISPGRLMSFLNEEQGMKVGFEYVQSLMQTFQPDGDVRYMTLPAFRSMMESPMFDLLAEKHGRVNQDMNQALSNYYIASSHNTYLMGGQLMGTSSIEGYISALERGCRCLELDLWDGPNGAPIVHHGYTRTSKILARDVLTNGIKPFAFKYSPFPLILSVENHLSMPQQYAFALDLRQCFGAALADPVECLLEETSPEQLRGRVIIKATGPKVTCPVLRSMLNVCRSTASHSVVDLAEVGNCYRVVSLSEKEAAVYAKKWAKISTAPSVMVRVFPSAARTGSSNFDPTPHWSYGYQMVALNYQTFDVNMELNLGFFRRNGGCGYVLKPASMRNRVGAQSSGRVRKLVRIRIVSGQNLSNASSDPTKGVGVKTVRPYVIIRLKGHPLDAFKFKTNHLGGNGLNPYWDQAAQVNIRVPELAVLLFAVKDVDTFNVKRTLATYALPVESLASGYRNVPFSSANSVSEPSSLFIHVQVTDFPECVF